jgi:hypothetical protein
VLNRTGALLRASGGSYDSGAVADLRREIKKTARPCGCKSGAAMALIALAGWPAWRAAAGLPTSVIGIAEAVLAWAGVVMCAAIAGKLAGIAVGRARHRRLLRRLEQALD